MNITILQAIETQQAKVTHLEDELQKEKASLARLESSANLCQIVEEANAAIAAAEERKAEAIAAMPPEIAKFYLSLSLSVESEVDVEVEVEVESEFDELNNDTTEWTPVSADYIADTRYWTLAERVGRYELHLRSKGSEEINAIALINDHGQSWAINEYHALSKYAILSAKDFLREMAIEEDWFETVMDIISDDDEWLEYEENNDGYAIYFRYDHKNPGSYGAIALIGRESADPRSWCIEAKFSSKEGAYLEAQNFLSRIESGEFAPEPAEAKPFDISAVIEKITTGKSLDRIPKDIIQQAATVVGVEATGSKAKIAEQIKAIAGSTSTKKAKKA